MTKLFWSRFIIAGFLIFTLLCLTFMQNKEYTYLYLLMVLCVIYIFCNLIFYIKECIAGTYLKRATISGYKFYTGNEIKLKVELNRKTHFSKIRKIDIFHKVNGNDDKRFFSNIHLFIKKKIKNLEVGLTFHNRGIYHLSDIDLLAQDVFNLSTIIYNTYNLDKVLMIIPSPVKNKKIDSLFFKIANTFNDRNHCVGIKEYQKGDRFKDINWKKSANSNGLIVNEKYGEVKTRINVFVDILYECENKVLFEKMLGTLVYLIENSEYKNQIGKIIIDNKEFDLEKERKDVFHEIACIKSRSVSDNNSISIPDIKNTVVLTTRILKVKNQLRII